MWRWDAGYIFVRRFVTGRDGGTARRECCGPVETLHCNVSTGSIRDGTDYRDADPVHAGYAYNQRAAIAYTRTDTFKEEMKTRAFIERIIAALVRYNGVRQAEDYGLECVDYQAKMAAIAYNLKRWAAMQRVEERAQKVKRSA
ncbi:MAG: transposase [Caldilineaceae bacterium]|nr:transposase [Caldilineaceae bacterium]